MAITDVSNFGGIAEIQGAQKIFSWDGKNLLIEGVGYTDVLHILDALAAGVMWDVRIPKDKDVTRPPVTAEAVRFPEVQQPVTGQPSAPPLPPSPPGELPLGDTSNAPKTLEPKDVTAHALQNADSLVKVLTYLKGKGFVEWKALLDECSRIREEVPLLKKINEGEFKDRLIRVMNTKLQIAVPEDA